MGAAVRSAVVGGLRRSQANPNRPAAADAANPPATSAGQPANSASQPRHAHPRMLARQRSRPDMPPAGPGQSGKRSDSDLIDATFPGLRPEVRAFFNTPVGDCDPAMLRAVLEALAGLIAGAMTPREDMRNAQDVFDALSNRLAAALDAGQTPADAVAEAAAPVDSAAAAPPDSAAAAAEDPQACAPGLAEPTQPLDPATGETPAARRPAGPATTAPDLPVTAPIEAASADPSVSDASTPNPDAPNRARIPPRHTRHRSCRTWPGRAARCRPLRNRNTLSRARSALHSLLRSPPRQPRLFCYAAHAGPRHDSGAPHQARRVARHARGTAR